MVLGIVFILVYITAIAVVLSTSFILVGYALRSAFEWFYVVLALPFFFGLGVGNTGDLYLLPTLTSYSSITVTDILMSCFVHHGGIVCGLALYFLLVGFVVIGRFRKNLHKRTSAGIRGLTLNHNLELVSFRTKAR